MAHEFIYTCYKLARHYPPEALANLTDEAQRQQVLRDGFASSFKVCGPQLTGSSAG